MKGSSRRTFGKSSDVSGNRSPEWKNKASGLFRKMASAKTGLFGRDDDSGRQISSTKEFPTNTSRKQKETEREERLMSIFATFELHGGPYVSDVITANSEGRMLGGLGDDGVLQMKWYRAIGQHTFDEIIGVNGGFYQPSIDDVDARLLCQAMNATNAGQSGWAEWGPLALDPEILEECETDVCSGGASYSVELVGTYDKPRKLTIDANSIVLEAPEHEEEDDIDPRAQAARRNRSSAVIRESSVNPAILKYLSGKVTMASDKQVKVKLEAAQPLQLTLTLPASAQLDGSAEAGTERPQTISLKTSSTRERDRITYVIRKFCGYPPNGVATLEQLQSMEASVHDDLDQTDEDELTNTSGAASSDQTIVDNIKKNLQVSTEIQTKDATQDGEDDGDQTTVTAEKEEETQTLMNDNAVIANDDKITDHEALTETKEMNGEPTVLEDVAEATHSEQSSSSNTEIPSTKHDTQHDENNNAVQINTDAKVKELTETVQRLRAEIVSKDQDTEEKSKQINALTQEIHTAKADALKASKESNRLRKEGRTLQTNITSLQKSLSDARSELTKTTRDLEKVQDELQEVQDAKSSAEDTTSNIQNQFESLQEEFAKLKSENKELKEQMARDKTSSNDSAKQCTELQAKVSELTASLKSQKAENEELTPTIQELRKDNSMLRRQVDQLRESVSNSERDATNARERLSTAQGALEEARTSAQRLSQHSKEDHAKLAKAEAQISSLSSDLVKANDTKKELQEQVTSLQSQIEAMETNQTDINRLQEDVSRLKETITDLRTKRNSLKHKFSSFKRDIHRAAGDLRRAMGLEVTESSVNNIPAQFDTITSYVQELQEQITQLRKQNGTLNSEIDHFRQSNGHSVTSPNSFSSDKSTSGRTERVIVTRGPAPNGRIEADLQRIIAELTDELNDKTEALAQQKSTKSMLGQRIRELEEQLANR